MTLRPGALVWEKHCQHTCATDSLFSAALAVSNDELWPDNTAVGVMDVNGVAGNGGTIDPAGHAPAGRDLLINSGYKTFGSTNA